MIAPDLYGTRVPQKVHLVRLAHLLTESPHPRRIFTPWRSLDAARNIDSVRPNPYNQKSHLYPAWSSPRAVALLIPPIKKRTDDRHRRSFLRRLSPDSALACRMQAPRVPLFLSKIVFSGLSGFKCLFGVKGYGNHPERCLAPPRHLSLVFKEKGRRKIMPEPRGKARMNYFTLAELKERGWTDTLIRDYLGSPDATLKNPRYASPLPCACICGTGRFPSRPGRIGPRSSPGLRSAESHRDQESASACIREWPPYIHQRNTFAGGNRTGMQGLP
jgi:hypothetical protein